MVNQPLRLRRRRHSLKAVFGAFISLAVSAALLPSYSMAAFRAGDVGFSLRTDAGQTWVYGDSWNNGAFIRNAMTLNDRYVGTVRGSSAVVPRSNWVWPGAPFQTGNGDIAMYAAEVASVKTKTGIWAFQVLGGVRAQFDPGHAGRATVTRMPRPGILWSAAAAKDPTSGAQYVYGIDANHHAHVAAVNPDNSVTRIRTMGGTISGQFTVLQDPADGRWWMVGNLPFLSRRVVAYPLSGPAGKVTGPALKLITLPRPGATRYVYAATVHPELNGLLTWAVNGSGAGTPYGLQRQSEFWPLALHFAQSATTTTTSRVARVRSLTASSQPRQTLSAGGDDDIVKLWKSSKQGDLQDQLDAKAKLDTSDNWLGDPPGNLEPGMDPNATAPAVWEFGDEPIAARNPVGEDDDSDTTFLVPATKAGFAAQQAAAQAAVTAARAAAVAAAAQLRAAELAAALAERQAEALKDAAEAGTQKERRAAEKTAEALKRDAEKAMAAAERALEKANKTLERALAALERANGKGRSSWGLTAG